jgi:hypothetical protein
MNKFHQCVRVCYSVETDHRVLYVECGDTSECNIIERSTGFLIIHYTCEIGKCMYPIKNFGCENIKILNYVFCLRNACSHVQLCSLGKSL